MQLNHKTLGAPNNISWDGKAHRVTRYNPHTQATYSWIEPDDDTTVSTSPVASGPAWDDGPALERAKAAGMAALRAGFGQSPRGDGLVPCRSCVKCAYRAYDQCRHPQQVAVVKAVAGQLQADRIAAAEAASAELSRTIWQQESARGMSF
jgi:hypothetical protein